MIASGAAEQGVVFLSLRGTLLLDHGDGIGKKLGVGYVTIGSLNNQYHFLDRHASRGAQLIAGRVFVQVNSQVQGLALQILLQFGTADILKYVDDPVTVSKFVGKHRGISARIETGTITIAITAKHFKTFRALISIRKMLFLVVEVGN